MISCFRPMLVAILATGAAGASYCQNPLAIPDTLAGPVYSLTVQQGSKTFFPGHVTPTFGYNGDLLGPTLFMKQGDSVTLNVTNQLPVATTVHWHGLHVAAINDGGPHQEIPPGSTWSPAFKVRNPAGTYWYHPHGAGKTELQVTRGLAGMIFLRDSAEASYTLPRHYGVDDFPLVLQTKAFDLDYRFAIATHEDSVPMVNGTIDPFLHVPRQVVRFRLVNGSADRSYLVGLADDRSFALIASDGGLLAQPHQMNRFRISPGERGEILVDFSAYSVGDSIDLVSFSSELPRGMIGADTVGMDTILMGEGYSSNPLNGADFRLLRLYVAPPTGNPVTTVPAAFAPLPTYDTSGVNVHRSIHFSADTLRFGITAQVDGPFSMNQQPFDMDSINFRIPLNSKEIWTLTNSTWVAHPFHIHDVPFFILDKNGNPPPPQEAGWKDVVVVMPGSTVRFITKFETFADDVVPYMYHCHLLHHEDDGMMGQFLVLNPPAQVAEAEAADEFVLYPNPTPGKVRLSSRHPGHAFRDYALRDAAGRLLLTGPLPMEGFIDLAGFPPGIYHLIVRGARGDVAARVVKLPPN